jgi:pyrroline-5-carboxylate reductase
MSRVTLIGAGQIGRSLLAGLREAGYPMSDVAVVTRDARHGEQLAASLGVIHGDLVAAAQTSSLIIIAVKPQDLTPVLESLSAAPVLHASVVSLCAGVSIEHIENALPEGTSVLRAMPNTPLSMRESMTIVARGTYATDADLVAVDALLSHLGVGLHLPESQLDAATALSGSGPAYLFYLAEALIEAGARLGLSPADAVEMVTQTMFGAATLLRRSERGPQQLRRDVSSPGGTTDAAIGVFDEREFSNIVHDAVAAARERSEQLNRPR